MSEADSVSDAVWKRGLANADTRLILRAILFKIARVDQGAYEPGDDALVTTFKDGRRSVGRDVRSQLDSIDPKAFVGLLAEDIDDAVIAAQKAKHDPA